MAHQYNGYVYHTRYDVSAIVPRGTFQNTGDNVLALVRELSNAPELEDPSVSSYFSVNLISPFIFLVSSFFIFLL